jgi:hypothetical protein
MRFETLLGDFRSALTHESGNAVQGVGALLDDFGRMTGHGTE